jgi:radical SAM superfamily enzyme YgiQ (UPF0313 family)
MPGGSPFSPPLSILSLGSYLQENGVDVALLDTSIDYFHYSLNPDYLRDWNRDLPSIAKRMASGGATLLDDFSQAYGFLQNIWTSGGFELGSLGDFRETVQRIEKAREFVELPFRPTILSAHLQRVPDRWRPVGLSVERRRDNCSIVYTKKHPLMLYWSEVLIPQLRRINPDLIGVSISYSEQAHGSYVLINEIRKLGIPIVVGGSYFHELFEGRLSSISSGTSAYARLAPLLHPFGILGEGEKPLLELCRCIEKGQPVDTVPGLFRHEGDQIILQKEGVPLSTEDLPIVDLDLLEGRYKYLSPMKIAPLMTSRGCYWNKCAFCNHANTIQSRWRELSVAKIVENIRQYREKHDIEYVLFCDECSSPRMLEQLSTQLVKEPRRVFFGTMSRFDKKLASLIKPLAAAGCRSLSFGLESGAQRVVDLMGKGYRLEDASSIIEQCAQQGILVELFIIFGFPTERFSEAVKTIEFLESNHRKIHVLRANPWYWKPDSPIGIHPERYGLEKRGRGEFEFVSRLAVGTTTTVSGGLARELVKSLADSPLLRHKMINITSSELQQEEFHVIANFCEGEMRPHIDIGDQTSPSVE